MKKKIIALLLTLLMIASAGCSAGNTASTDTMNEYPASNTALITTAAKKPASKDSVSITLPTKAVWISFLEYQQILQKKTEVEFTQSVNEMMDNCVDLGLNTVVIQARAHGDAYYPSTVYPWAKFASGTAGQPLDFDPFGIMVDAAKERGLSVHAWINPYRLMQTADMELIDDSYTIKQWYNSPSRSRYMQLVNGYWWLNPARQDCRKLVYRGVRELVRNYDIDAIHMDDYFYTADCSKFGHTRKTAVSATTKLVKGIQSAIKAINPAVQFGISPAAGISPSLVPDSDTKYYTNLKLWCTSNTYIDYVMPQIYWGFDHQTADFITVCERWSSIINTDQVDFMAGLAIYKSGTQDKFAGSGKKEWIQNTNIIASQVDYLNSLPNSSGFCLFRYNNLFAANTTKQAKQETQNLRDLLLN